MSNQGTSSASAEVAAAMAAARILTIRELELRVADERESGRAFGPLAEACRLELAKRTGQPS